ncbi:chalcone isomerase family protein [Acinetobacter sp. NIPH 1852]|uniref:chalcone isomerase family protein n=1 Tax=Acinetobacter sp. NIPH 1852 TaxID=2923428 RepID=UPI001F4B1BEB|nr:chalcone isomerase family protein [Acinetobacter sp. NIPH 1852]MCH7307193.1 chalcone isomerase family protein [Acinetobacter sp. NIPH 1852]
MRGYYKNLLLLSSTLFLLTTASQSSANTQLCKNAALIVTKKEVGNVSYYAADCTQKWETQDIQLDFLYTRDIPEWAFKRAATHFLKKNIPDYSENSPLNRITALYKPVRKGDLYSLKYTQSNQTLSLSLNQKPLGKITDNQANQYFKIWFGSSPFNAKLKQQLLNQ